MQYIRQWKVGDQTFDNKHLALRYEATRALSAHIGDYPSDQIASRLLEDADTVIALLKPFATPRARKPRATNGATKAEPKPPSNRRAAAEAQV